MDLFAYQEKGLDKLKGRVNFLARRNIGKIIMNNNKIIIDVRNRSSVLIMKGFTCLGRFQSYEIALLWLMGYNHYEYPK